jgi:acyl-CoA synthetase (AMP-forming)/AMP-acid ligase II
MFRSNTLTDAQCQNKQIDDTSFWRDLVRFGDTTAVVRENGERISYGELTARADDFAQRLGKERRLVAIEAHNSLETLCGYLGALRGGHPVVLLPPGADERNLGIYANFAPDARYRLTDEGWELTLSEPAGGLHNDLALALSTSGTTGSSKLVRLSGRALSSNANAIVRYLGIDVTDRAITSLPLYYSYGLSVVNSHLAAGATLLLTERSLVEGAFWDYFEREGGTSFAGVPHSYDLLERGNVLERDLPTLKTLTQAGGKMPVAAIKRMASWAQERSVRFFLMYGQTEATARMAYLPPEHLADSADCIGKAIPGGLLTLVDEDGAIIRDAGRTGELVYRGPNVMMGYAMSRGDLARASEIDALYTGDLARWTKGGLLQIVGRKSRFIKPFGLRVDLDEIEATLREWSIVAFVAGAEDLVAIAYQGGPDPEGLVEMLAARTKLPASLFQLDRVDAFPVLRSGKPDYPAVLHAARSRLDLKNVEGNSESLAASFAAILRRPVDPAKDSFNELEGDSLSYVSVAMEIDRRLGYLPDRWEEMMLISAES